MVARVRPSARGAACRRGASGLSARRPTRAAGSGIKLVCHSSLIAILSQPALMSRARRPFAPSRMGARRPFPAHAPPTPALWHLLWMAGGAADYLNSVFIVFIICSHFFRGSVG